MVCHMDEFSEVDIFIQAMAVAVIVVSVATIVVLYRLDRVLRHIERIVERMAIESMRVQQDIANVRGSAYDAVNFVKSTLKTFLKFTQRTSKKA